VSLGPTLQGVPAAPAHIPVGQDTPSRSGRRATNTQFSVEFIGVGRSFAREARGSTKPRGARRDSATSTHLVVRDVTLSVVPGEVVGILGISGCGKSTLLRIAAGLDNPTLGAVRIDGTPVAGIDARCAVAFQEPRLLPWRTLAANVAIGLPPGTPGDDGALRVAQLLDLVGLTAFAEHRPREVSGGMAQRASLARALARDPGVLLLDEPFASLDALTRMRMQDLLLDVHAAAPTTVLLVTHDVDEALQLSDRVILLGTEPGRPGATIRHVVTVPGDRPRDRGSAEIAELRATLLEGLGVSRHAH
jgi:sulfonate transport system ATP-binding protein